VKPSQRKVGEFLDEWLAVVKDSVKPSTYQNYVDYTEAYAKPAIGERRLQDITVPMLNMLYRRLLTSGRSKPDNNAKMYAYWIAAASAERSWAQADGHGEGMRNNYLRGRGCCDTISSWPPASA
jgi:hypothetical protein